MTTLTLTRTLTGATRTFSATATTQDTAQGLSVQVTFAQSTVGLTPPDTPNNDILLGFYIDNGATLIRQVSIPGATASQNVTYHFTDTGSSGGATRCGTVRMRLFVNKTNGGPTETYTAQSDTAADDAGGSFTVTTRNQGWIRGTTTATAAVSNVALGGAKVEPAVFAESVFVRVTTGSPSYNGYAVTVAFAGTSKTKATPQATSSTKDVTFSGTGLADGRVNEGFPAADDTYSTSLSVATTSNLTGQGITSFTSTTDDTLRVDPRLTCVHLFQLDDNSVGTPPLVKQHTNNERPSSSIGYFATGIHHARGGVAGNVMSGGVNGLTVSIVITAPNSDTISRTATTANNGGEDGWTTGFLQWTSPLPGGDWVKVVDVTAPSDIDADTYLRSTSATYVLLAARSPFVVLVADVGHATGANNDRHLHPGDELEVQVYFKHTQQRVLLVADTDPLPAVSFERIRNGVVERLNGSLVWESAETDGALVFHDMTLLPTSSYIYRLAVTTDGDWGDVTVNLAASYQAVSYDAVASREFVGEHHPHDTAETGGGGGNDIDPLALAMHGVIEGLG